MNFVEELFDRYHPVFRKLKAYGFCVVKNTYVYEKQIMDGSFRVEVRVDQSGKVRAKVFDNDLNEEYINVYAKTYGAYVSMVKEAFIAVLEDIREACFEREVFVYPQSKEVCAYIYKQYGVKEEFIWKKFPSYAVFRDHGKWFALLLNVNGKKLSLDDREYEILNVRCEEKMIAALKENDGFHEAYHMNKEKWISVVLDNTIDNEILYSLIDFSYSQVETSDAWIVPANPKYYDVVHAFDQRDTLLWKKSSDIHEGDIVYLYVGAPVSSVLFKCEVLKSDIPYEYKDKNVSMNALMQLRLLKRYKKDMYSFAWLNEHGIKAVRGPRRLPEAVCDEID